MENAKTTPDWERIEVEYRAGVLSLREIASQHGITHGAINKRAKRDGWERDLSAKITAKAEALVSKQAVSKEVSARRLVTEREVIEANATRIAQVRGEHRADINRARTLALTLLEELECQTGSVELLRELGDFMRSEDDKGNDKRNELYRKIIDSPQRIDSLKKLSETLKNLIGLEREAYGIGNGSEPLPGSAVFERIERVIVRPSNRNA